MAKYNKTIVDRICSLIEKDSYTINEICSLSGIHVDTYYDWMKRKPEFSDAIEKARDKFDKLMLVECEKSLSKLIRGYEYIENKTVFTKGFDGKQKPKETTATKKYVPPSLGAIIHFQTNKDPENWKNRQTSELTGKGGKDLIPARVLSKQEMGEVLSKLENEY